MRVSVDGFDRATTMTTMTSVASCFMLNVPSVLFTSNARSLKNFF